MTDTARPDTELTEAHRDRIKRALKSRARLDAIRRTGLADAPSLHVPALERAARLAALALHAPVSQVNLLTDTDQQPLAVYTEAPAEDAQWRARRQAGSSYCKYVIWTKQPFIVDDSLTHALVRQSRATRDLAIGAYLGVPIRASADATGAVVGSLCVIDRAVRQWTSRDVELLLDLAAAVSDEIEHRATVREQVASVEGQSARVLQHAGVAILTTDAKGVTTFANPAALRTLGYSESELLGHDQHALIHHSHADGSRYNESDCPNYHGRREGRPVRSTSDTFWRSDGTPITVDSLMTPIFDHGEVIGSVLTFQDVTERSEAHATERTARVAAQAANRAKTALLTELSRELRLPIAAITDHIERLESSLVTSASPEQRAELASIRRSVQHLAGLTENVVGFATIETLTDSAD